MLSATFHAGDDEANYLRHSSSDTVRAFEEYAGLLKEAADKDGVETFSAKAEAAIKRAAKVREALE